MLPWTRCWHSDRKRLENLFGMIGFKIFTEPPGHSMEHIVFRVQPRPTCMKLVVESTVRI